MKFRDWLPRLPPLHFCKGSTTEVAHPSTCALGLLGLDEALTEAFLTTRPIYWATISEERNGRY